MEYEFEEGENFGLDLVFEFRNGVDLRLGL